MSDKNEASEVRLQDETILYLREQIREAVGEGIRSALTTEAAEAFWGAGLALLHRQAREHTGRFVLGGLFSLVKRLWMVIAIFGLIYATGGWPAVVGLVKSVFSNPAQ